MKDKIRIGGKTYMFSKIITIEKKKVFEDHPLASSFKFKKTKNGNFYKLYIATSRG